MPKMLGLLTVHPTNPRYFTDGSGRAICLTGSHTWNNLQHNSVYPGVDYERYLDFLKEYNHNFIRLWVWEQAGWDPYTNDQTSVDPLPYQRTGPGLALDGKPYTNWKDGSGKPRYYTNYGVDQPYGCFGRDRIDRGPTKGPFICGCIAYRLKSQRVVSISGLFAIGCQQPGDGWIENCAALVEEGADAVRPFSLSRVDGHNLTAIGGSELSIKRGSIANVLAALNGEDRAAWSKMLQENPPENGAHIYYRYENGKLTDKPIWPWPMNDRIKELKGIDVTATIFGLSEPHTDP
jgi:hypothetical protein